MEKETSSGTKQLTDEEEATCLLKSANILAKAFSPFQGASHAVLECAHRTWGEESDLLKMRTNAVEMAIIGEAKQFIRSPACQRVIGESPSRPIPNSWLTVPFRGHLDRPYWCVLLLDVERGLADASLCALQSTGK